MRRLWPSTVGLVFCLLGLGASKPETIEGHYQIPETGRWISASLDLVAAEDRVLLYFAGVFGETAHICECVAEAQAIAPDRYKVTQSDPLLEGSLIVQADRLILEVTAEQCCGAGFPGAPHFFWTQRKPLRRCTVLSQKAVLRNTRNEATRAYLVAGDVVEATDSEPGDNTVLVRYSGKRTTLGRLQAEDLSCP